MDYQQQQQGGGGGYNNNMRAPPPLPRPSAGAAADPYLSTTTTTGPSSNNSQQQQQRWSHHPYNNNNNNTGGHNHPQFQYPSQSQQHSPSPPPQFHPPQHQQQPSPYHPPPSYPQQQHHPHYPPPQPHRPPLPPPHHHPQEWGSGSTTTTWASSNHHPTTLDYPPKNNNEEDWAAKARAWAAAKSVTDNQNPPPSQQFIIPAGRPEDQNHFRDQYSQSNGTDVHTPLAPPTSYQQHPVGIGLPSRTDMHPPYAMGGGNIVGDSTAPYGHQENPSMSSYVHQQEVPSSYSSVAGNQDAGDRYENFNSSPSLPVASNMQYPMHSLPPAGGRPGWMEEPHQSLSQPGPLTDPSDQPLSFAPHFNRGPDPHVQHSYNHSSGGPIASNYAWTPSSAPGHVFPPVPPTIQSGPQVDHPMAMHSPASGHPASLFPTGPGFQPTPPMIGTSFSVGPGVTPHPTAFSGDAYGVPGVPDRPKKASVPNWLREEIIKNKAVIPSSVPEVPKEDSQSLEDHSPDKFSRKEDQADSKSIDSSRSAEDEEDEDEVEAARAAAINQEIKRVLTEVLLKVTDELFDEIATKVLKEDDLSVEVGHDLSNHQVLQNIPSTSTPKASARVLIPTKAKGSDYEESSEKSTSGAPGGDILGLGSYASDEDDEEIESSNKLNMKEISSNQQSSSTKLPDGNPVIGNGDSREEPEKRIDISTNLESDGTGRKSPVIATSNDHHRSSERLSVVEDESRHGSDFSKSKNSSIEKGVERNEKADEKLDARKLSTDDSRIKDSGNRSSENDRHDIKKSSTGKHYNDKNGDEGHKKHEERRGRTERMEDKGRERGRSAEKAKNSESRKRSSPTDGKEGTSETRRVKRTSSKEDDHEKRRDRTGDEKKERSRHKSGSESSRHKRHSNDSSDVSDDSKRKTHHSRRRKSPSPIRSRRRHVSRSPHSKHSKRRHSPYSSHDTTRGKRSVSRSRSRSPVHRRR